MSEQKKARIILMIEKLRLVESELFRITSKYGIKTVSDLDKLVSKGKLSEKVVGEDLFLFDHFFSQKKALEKKLSELKVKKSNVWKSLQNLLELPKLSSRM